MGFQALQDLVGQSDGSQGVLAADLRARPALRRVDEVLELQGERLTPFGLDAIDAEDLAEEVLFDGGRLAQVDALEVEPAVLQLLGRTNQRGLLGGEVQRGVPFRAQIRILRTAA